MQMKNVLQTKLPRFNGLPDHDLSKAGSMEL